MYINRDVSWLKFNSRVLQEAADLSVPLLERLKFLGIYSNNLDEFYKVRYPAIQNALASGSDDLYENIVENQTPEELIIEINQIINAQQEIYEELYLTLLKELDKENIHLINEENLSKNHQSIIKKIFDKKLAHTLTILFFNQGKWIKQLRDGRLYLMVRMTKANDEHNFAIIEVPTRFFPRFVELPVYNFQNYVIFLEDIIRFHLKEIFNAFDFIKIESNAFKITRDAEIYIDNDLDRSILENISMGVRERKKGEPVRMVYDKNMPEDALNYLKEILDLDDYDSMIPGSRYLNKRDFMSFPDFGRKDLLYNKISPIVPKELFGANSLIKIIAKKDVLLYTPYHDYSIFIKFLREAAIDPKVKKIGISIYRVAKDSQVMNALVNAARNGKEVIAVLELTARFDEENNVYWSKELQEEGIKVIFGVPGLKVHSKLVYVEREIEDKKTEKYAIVSSGNFNEKTATVYTDYTLFTCDKRITNEVDDVFRFFQANYLLKPHKHLIVSPLETREKLNKLIDTEIANAKTGLPSAISLKINSLSDKQIIDKLYEASSNGVKIRMVVRGICCLVPGIKNQSENIEIVSVIDKFLEHSRVYSFKNAGNDKVYISSADLMTRNIDKRVEVFSEIYDQNLKDQVIDCFELSFNDSVKGRLVSDKLSESYQLGKNHQNRSQFSIYEYYKSK